MIEAVSGLEVWLTCPMVSVFDAGAPVRHLEAVNVL